jgi:hypothetical protein
MRVPRRRCYLELRSLQHGFDIELTVGPLHPAPPVSSSRRVQPLAPDQATPWTRLPYDKPHGGVGGLSGR